MAQPKQQIPDKKFNYTENQNLSQSQTFPVQLLESFDVLDYQIHLQIFPNSQEIYGSTMIRLRVLEQSMDSLCLHFSGLQVDSVLSIHSHLVFKQETEYIISFFTNQLIFNDITEVTIYYHGKPLKGIYFYDNRYYDKVVYSHNEPFDARYWFPCKDNPSDKAFADLYITMPEEYVVLANGKIINQSLHSTGWQTTHWRENYPIATYLISIAAAPYIIIERDFYWGQIIMPLQYYVYPQDQERAEKALQSTEEIMNFFSHYIGEYPFINEKYVMAEVPFKMAAAMENQTATTMSEIIMDDENVIAHELAHQWWGDALTPHSFADIWLNEGFATYFDALFTEFKYGSNSFKNQLEQYRSAINQDGSLVYPIYAPPESYLFGSAVYYKGAWILHMLRHQAGDDCFKEICRSYYRNYQYKNVTTGQFISICDSVCGRSWQHFFNQWLYYGGIPELSIIWEQAKDKVTIQVEQKQHEVIYQFDLEILLEGMSCDSLISIAIDSREVTAVFQFPDLLTAIKIDPYLKILSVNNSKIKTIHHSQLLAIYPNPTRNHVIIAYQLDRIQDIELQIWNILGQKIETVFKGKGNMGNQRITWQNYKLASGLYYCVLQGTNFIDVMRMIIIK